jgi:uncharacterized protein YjaZ
MRSCDTQERLLDRLVGEGLAAGHVFELGGDGGEDGVRRVAEVVVVEQAGVSFLDKLGVWTERQLRLNRIEAVSARDNMGKLVAT